MDPNEMTTLLADLFDNPPPSTAGAQPVPVAEAWGSDDDDQFVGSLVARADVSAEELSPEEMMGTRQWRRVVAEDPVYGGEPALDEARAAWNWSMTRGQRARMVADVAFGERMDALIDSFTKSAVRRLPDPFDYAAEVAAERRA